MSPSLNLLTLLIIFFFTPLEFLSASERGILLTEEMTMKVADAFMAEREFYRAITEYKKFLILFPESDKGDYALLKIGLAYYHGEEYEASVRNLENLREKYPDSSAIPESMYFSGLGYWKLKKYENARISLEGILKFYPDSTYAPEALIANTMLELDQDHVDNSMQDMEKLFSAYPDHPASIQAKETLILLNQYRNLPGKSEILAGVMSAIVPGSGYVYAEHYGDGITAFLINALAVVGTVTAVGNENYAVAAIVGGIGMPFYFGNIYGSANAVKKWNMAVRRELRNRISVTLNHDF
jgi:TolA-binding protein